MTTFGERLAHLRSSKDLSQAELANRLNIAKSTLAMYETDKRQPNFEIIQKIADYFDVSIDFLLGRTKDSKEEVALTEKEKRDIARDIERMLADLESEESLAFHGEPMEMDDETKELLKSSLEHSMRIAKQMAKRKFTPKKYKK